MVTRTSNTLDDGGLLFFREGNNRRAIMILSVLQEFIMLTCSSKGWPACLAHYIQRNAERPGVRMQMRLKGLCVCTSVL